MKVDEYNSKAAGMANGRDQKVWQFSENEFWKNIGCLISDPTFCLGSLMIWQKEEAQKISGKKRQIISIIIKVDLYEVCLSYIIYCLIFYL